MFSKKKFFAIVFVSLVCCLFSSVHAADAAKTNNKTKPHYEIDYAAIGHNLLWYLPNCLMDLADCFTIEFGAGDIALDIDVTKYASFGAGIGNSYNMGWTNKRQIGFFKDANYNADFLCFSNYERNRSNLLGNYKDVYTSNVSSSDIINYPRAMRFEDPYAIGVKAAFLFGVKIQFHPVEFLDFLGELFLFDLNKDSNKKEMLQITE